MTTSLRDLLLHSDTTPLVPAPPVSVVDGRLTALLGARNGFFAFSRALHVFPSTLANVPVMTLEQWNAAPLWVGGYADAAVECLFFAEDIFGTQFCLSHGRVWSFDPETGDKTEVAATIDGWAATILADPDVQLGSGLAAAWERAHGPLPEGQRLVPVTPFVLGGDFTLENLRAMSAVESMRYRADVASQLRGVPDGTAVDLRVR